MAAPINIASLTLPAVYNVALADFDGYFGRAVQSVEGGYFHLQIDGGNPIYRERVYCYELYHQLRVQMDADRQTQFTLNGEVDKRDHPTMAGFREVPDILYHTPGDMRGNLVIVEIKHFPANNWPGFKKDLKTLSKFIAQANYRRAILLVYGTGHQSDKRIRNFARLARRWSIAEPALINLAGIELRWHHTVNQPTVTIPWPP